MVFQDSSLNPRFTPRARSSIRFRGLGDIRERDALRAKLRGIRGIVYVSHDLKVVRLLCDHVIVMRTDESSNRVRPNASWAIRRMPIQGGC